ncbi:peptide chain release factor N(5)-glutamine methyltransferase [Streptomyces lonarensis]|uniref:Release factor glutamine methyltransferase n=1 Tax=Streptomyces lonarensis TaxID=700599 RepID=A0A7X6CYM7_9ACTN|nr:peptide chain release factor N(5)-glutamine methyltransferase [Streptomyces lonarensis]NJQ04982.1 peptide chain release factor N(5)-glutamine methyltransferase [Streptomyces lonarensis]
MTPTSPPPRSLLLAEVAQATQRLAAAGVASPRFDAEELAAFVHATDRAKLHLVGDADFDARYWEAVARREAREPLQHITGRAFFRYLELQVGAGVFVPRPETESVVGWAIDAVRAMDVAEPLIVDLCTGSGAIALALAQEVPRSRVHAVELDEDALGWARRNVANTAEGSRVTLHHGDALTALPELDGQVDLVVSNPPYIPLTEWEYVAPEARDHDPELALFSGEDGLETIRGLERTARRLLRPGGIVVVEHADTQGGQVPWIFTEDRGWADAADHPDLNNRPRFATARRVTR